MPADFAQAYALAYLVVALFVAFVIGLCAIYDWWQVPGAVIRTCPSCGAGLRGLLDACANTTCLKADLDIEKAFSRGDC